MLTHVCFIAVLIYSLTFFAHRGQFSFYSVIGDNRPYIKCEWQSVSGYAWTGLCHKELLGTFYGKETCNVQKVVIFLGA